MHIGVWTSSNISTLGCEALVLFLVHIKFENKEKQIKKIEKSYINTPLSNKIICTLTQLYNFATCFCKLVNVNIAMQVLLLQIPRHASTTK
jgi:hypothetical protein